MQDGWDKQPHEQEQPRPEETKCTHKRTTTRPSGSVYCDDCGKMLAPPMTGYMRT
jgi:hypothetical protein